MSKSKPYYLLLAPFTLEKIIEDKYPRMYTVVFRTIEVFVSVFKRSQCIMGKPILVCSSSPFNIEGWDYYESIGTVFGKIYV